MGPMGILVLQPSDKPDYRILCTIPVRIGQSCFQDLTTPCRWHPSASTEVCHKPRGFNKSCWQCPQVFKQMFHHLKLGLYPSKLRVNCSVCIGLGVWRILRIVKITSVTSRYFRTKSNSSSCIQDATMRLCAVNLANSFSLFQPVGQTAMGQWGIEKDLFSRTFKRGKKRLLQKFCIGLKCLAFAHWFIFSSAVLTKTEVDHTTWEFSAYAYSMP